MAVRIETGFFKEFFQGKTAGRHIHTGLDIIQWPLVSTSQKNLRPIKSFHLVQALLHAGIRNFSFLGMVQSWVAASSAAWGWQSSKSGATIPKSFGFEAATRYGATNQCYPESDLFEPCRFFLEKVNTCSLRYFDGRLYLVKLELGLMGGFYIWLL